jgi:ATP-dependent exoDNAse (exonuclease V) beta subunit
VNAPPDFDLRARALDVSRSFIVQAPAGSGKTELLIRRYLALLAIVDRPEQIIAITFTRKAAAQMRGRILEALAAARDAPASAERDEELMALARSAVARSRSCGWMIDSDPDRLQVQTIDALCAWLTRCLPLGAGFGAQPRIAEEPVAIYRRVARMVLAELGGRERWSAAIESLLEHLDNDLPRLEALLIAMLARRDQWERHFVTGDLEAKRARLEAALSRAIAAALAALDAAIPRACRAEIAALASSAGENLAASGSDSPIVALAGLTELPPPVPEARAQWAALAELLLTARGELRRQPTAAQGFPPASAPGGAGQGAAAADRKNRFARLIDRLRDCAGLAGLLHAARDLPHARYGDDQWRVLAALGEVLRLAALTLRGVFAEQGEIDFQGVAGAAIAALGEVDAPTDLALALDYRIQHVLIDEFQDTSHTQYELLRRLTAGWQPGDGRTVFLVGDPMQSIYRFREAQVGLFLELQAQGRMHGVALEPITLSANFRAQSRLVAWVNEAFAKVLPAVGDAAAGAVPFSPSTATRDAATDRRVEIHALAGAGRGAEAQAVAALIERLRGARPRESIAVLARSRSHLDAIAARLREAALPFRAVEIDPLAARPVILDLHALTRALVHPADRIAWLAILRGPWCGLGLADLEALAGGRPDAPLPSLLADPDRLAGVSVDARRRLARVWPVLRSALENLGRRPLERLVEAVWIGLGGPACLIDRSGFADARAFFDLLAAHAVAGDLIDLEAFADALESLFAAPDPQAGPQLQLMTIHKAKGLEFDVVIVPGLGRAPHRGEPALLAWLQQARLEDAPDLLLAPLAQAGGSDPVYRFIERLDRRRERHEQGRLLYVAATRAREELHLFGHAAASSGGAAPRPPPGSLLEILWPAVEGHFPAPPGEGMPPPAAGRESMRERRPPSRLAGDWEPPALPPGAAWRGAGARIESPPPVEYAWAQPTIRHVGTIVHRWLQRIAVEGLRAWPPSRIETSRAAVRAALRAEGVGEGELDEASARALAALAATLGEPRGRWLLAEEHAQARAEYRLSGVVGSEVVNVVVDRTFVDRSGTRWIVDYKTSAHEGADLDAFLDREVERHRPQLERYAALLGRIDGRPLRCALYYPLLGGWREWQPARSE